MAQITASDYKLYRNITQTDATRDARITVLISAVEASAARYLGRVFDSGSVTSEEHDWNIYGVYWLRRIPVTAFTSVSAVDSSGNATVIPSGNYRYDSATGEFRLYEGATVLNTFTAGVDANTLPMGFRSIRFAYTGGSTVPADLKLTLLQMVDDLYTANEFGQGVNHRLSGGSLGDMSYSWLSVDELAKLNRKYLLPYKTGGIQ